jgi:hypothetical protein
VSPHLGQGRRHQPNNADGRLSNTPLDGFHQLRFRPSVFFPWPFPFIMPSCPAAPAVQRLRAPARGRAPTQPSPRFHWHERTTAWRARPTCAPQTYSTPVRCAAPVTSRVAQPCCESCSPNMHATLLPLKAVHLCAVCAGRRWLLCRQRGCPYSATCAAHRTPRPLIAWVRPARPKQRYSLCGKRLAPCPTGWACEWLTKACAITCTDARRAALPRAAHPVGASTHAKGHRLRVTWSGAVAWHAWHQRL